jgi:hypothetical protein
MKATAKQLNSKRKFPRKPASKNGDAFLADKKVFRGRTPRDLAANHDHYFYRASGVSILHV